MAKIKRISPALLPGIQQDTEPDMFGVLVMLTSKINELVDVVNSLQEDKP